MNGNNSPPFILSLPIYAKRETPLRACGARFLICGAGALNHHDSSDNRIKNQNGDYEDNDSMTSSIISIRTMSDNENDEDGDFDDRNNFFDHRLSNQRQIVGDFSHLLDYGRNGGNDDAKSYDDVAFDGKNDENDDGCRSGITVASVAINNFDTESLLERSMKGNFELYSDPLFDCDVKATKYIVEKRRFFQNYCSPSKIKQKRQLGAKSNKLSNQIPTVVLENHLNDSLFTLKWQIQRTYEKVYANVGDDYVEIKRLSILLFKQFAFATGVRTFEGLPILTFPNRNLIINYGDYKCLISYLHQNLPYDDTYKGYVLIIDRRLDKWANVKTILGYISNYFLAKIKAIYLVKPNGVLQKALEVGFKRSIECFNFPLIICNVLEELHCYLNPSLLTADLQGNLVYNHFEWVRNCVDVEKMKSSAKNISESLTDFADFIRDGDMYANDASTTKKLIESQIFEHQAIKRDFISVRRQGYSVLQQVRRVDLQPNAELLSPTRLHHVTTVERLLLQLEDTERSFDNFWCKHEVRLGQKFQLRSFEEEFKKLQTNLSRHISHVEESRQIGNNVDSVNALISKHRIYVEHAEETMTISEKLREKGEYLMKQEVSEIAGGSLKPKCDELDRLNELLKQNLENRLLLLRHSKRMHEQIGAANAWCTKGVELLTNLSPLLDKESESKKCSGSDGFIPHFPSENDRILEKEDSSSPVTSSGLLETHSETIRTTRKLLHSFDRMSFSRKNSDLLTSEDLSKKIDDFLTVGHCLKFDSFGRQDSEVSSLMNEIMKKSSVVGKEITGIPTAKVQSVTTDTSVLLEQVGSRIEDIRRMCESRKTHLYKQHDMCSGSTPPEKPSEKALDSSSEQSNKGSISLLIGNESCSNVLPDLVVASSNMDNLPAKVTFILDELLTTEKIYVQDLVEITEFYSKPFFVEYKTGGNSDEIIRIHELIFGNLDEILTFHSQTFLPQLIQACRQCPRNVAHCFEDSVVDFTNLYETYCRNKSREDQCPKLECFQDLFQKCQVKAGHLLPLSAYLLKPVQRITKYQLLLQEMAKCCRNREDEYDVSHALQCMLDLLSELNSSFIQIKITGYPSNVYNLGPTLINGPFVVWQTKRLIDKTATVVANLRRNAKAQRRHLFLFENFLILCKTRRQSSMNQAESYYEFKMEINLKNVRLLDELEFDRRSYKFALSISNWAKNNLTSSPSLAGVIFVCQPMDSDQCALWIEKMEKVLSSAKKTAVVDLDSRSSLNSSRCASWKSDKSNISNSSESEITYGTT